MTPVTLTSTSMEETSSQDVKKRTHLDLQVSWNMFHNFSYITFGKFLFLSAQFYYDFCAGLCSHAFAWETFDAAANRDLEACPCSGNAECTCLTCSYECDNPIKLGPEMPPRYEIKFKSLFLFQIIIGKSLVCN